MVNRLYISADVLYLESDMHKNKQVDLLYEGDMSNVEYLSQGNEGSGLC